MITLNLRQFSSLEKIITVADINRPATDSAVALAGEHVSYQIGFVTQGELLENHCAFSVEVDSPLADCIKLYSVKPVPADLPHTECNDDDYITHTPAMIPDLLVPLDEQSNLIYTQNQMAVLWVEVALKKDCEPGTYPIKVRLTGRTVKNDAGEHGAEANFTLEVLPAMLPEQKLMYTQWFHIDCIATTHNVPIYSEAHWELIERYMAMAVDHGINMILTPVITPPLDTAVNSQRPCVQLVDIEKNSGIYHFDFSRLRRFIALTKKLGIRYYEICHFFSQWGCICSPNIWGKEDGEEKLLFGWHVPTKDPSYAEFLQVFIPQVLAVLREENILDACYFHVSDEPTEEQMADYEYARSLLKPLLGDCKTFDALSDIGFYEKGLVDYPVCANDHIEPFLERKVPHLWTYYCCGQLEKVSNRFIAVPSYRNRIMGLQMYKFGIEGFLQWGYNFYNCRFSMYPVNPYLTTSADGSFASGDSFSVYPGQDGPLPSLRALVFREALEDMEVCRLLEQKIGKQAVVELIDQEAGMNLTFSEFPRNVTFIPNLMQKMKRMLMA